MNPVLAGVSTVPLDLAVKIRDRKDFCQLHTAVGFNPRNDVIGRCVEIGAAAMVVLNPKTGPDRSQFFRAFWTLQEGVNAMKRKRYTDEQIAFALRQADGGRSVEEICRKLGVSEPTFYRWKKQFAGMGVVEIRRLK